MSTLNLIHKYFPAVTLVKDSKDSIPIEVTKRDASSKEVKNHGACAMAVACKRAFHLDGAIISRSVAYLVKGNTAVKFKLSPSVSREITSFDRGAGFEPGEYLLSPVPNSLKGKRKKETIQRKNKQFRHLTTKIRTVLGGQEPKE